MLGIEASYKCQNVSMPTNWLRVQQNLIVYMYVNGAQTSFLRCTQCSYVISLINISTYSGTGKSHFRALISGKERPSCRQSTALATEADQIVPAACMTHDFEEEMVEFHRYKYGSKVKWLVVKNKKLSQLIAKTIHNQTKGRQRFSDKVHMTL